MPKLTQGRFLVGKTIASVELNKFNARDDYHATSYDPVICFTDGSTIHFMADETDDGLYGVSILYYPVRRRREKRL